MLLNRKRGNCVYLRFLPVFVTFLKPACISVCLISGGMCFFWRSGFGISSMSMILNGKCVSSIFTSVYSGVFFGFIVSHFLFAFSVDVYSVYCIG